MPSARPWLRKTAADIWRGEVAGWRALSEWLLESPWSVIAAGALGWWVLAHA